MGKRLSDRLSAGFLAVCIAAGLAAAGVAGGRILGDLLSYRQAREEYAGLQTSYIKEEETQKEESESHTDADKAVYPDMDIDFAAMRRINPDLVGILCIPSLDLCYPVVQGKTDTEYLKKTFYGTENGSGCIFMDTATNPDLSDANTFLFGHNMKNGTMFGSLKRLYQEENLCREDPYLYFYSEKTVRKYEIFSYYVTEADSDAYQGIADEADYDAYVRKAKERSLYASGSSTDLSKYVSTDLTAALTGPRPALLTLSTCSGPAGGTQRFLVHSVSCGEYSL